MSKHFIVLIHYLEIQFNLHFMNFKSFWSNDCNCNFNRKWGIYILHISLSVKKLYFQSQGENVLTELRGHHS